MTANRILGRECEGLERFSRINVIGEYNPNSGRYDCFFLQPDDVASLLQSKIVTYTKLGVACIASGKTSNDLVATLSVEKTAR